MIFLHCPKCLFPPAVLRGSARFDIGTELRLCATEKGGKRRAARPLKTARSIPSFVHCRVASRTPAQTSDAITDWSVIERCRADYPFERLHLEAQQVADLFGDITPGSLTDRAASIHHFLHARFPQLFASPASFRLGFDVAASGQGHLAAIYVDEVKGPELWLRALFTCRTEDWHFLSVTLSTFLRDLHAVHAAGDESGLGRQICWEMSRLFPGRFTPVNFASKKHDLGFALMNQLSHSQKRFPSGDHDIAADFFALRKAFVGQRWVFSEARNQLNPASHCDIAWAGALATHAHLANKSTIGARVG